MGQGRIVGSTITVIDFYEREEGCQRQERVGMRNINGNEMLKCAAFPADRSGHLTQRASWQSEYLNSGLPDQHLALCPLQHTASNAATGIIVTLTHK